MRQRRLRWDDAPRPLPKRPYRDTALVYLGFAALIVIVSALTGGDVGRAVVIAGLFWAAATAYGWVRWRRRLRQHDEERQA